MRRATPFAVVGSVLLLAACSSPPSPQAGASSARRPRLRHPQPRRQPHPHPPAPHRQPRRPQPPCPSEGDYLVSSTISWVMKAAAGASEAEPLNWGTERTGSCDEPVTLTAEDGATVTIQGTCDGTQLTVS